MMMPMMQQGFVMHPRYSCKYCNCSMPNGAIGDVSGDHHSNCPRYSGSGSSLTTTSSSSSSRSSSSRVGNARTLYHQTDLDGLRGILSTGRMNRGSSGYAGGGIYFAGSASETHQKAHSKGAILRANVSLGSSKTISKSDGDIDFNSLKRSGYDSVHIQGLRTGDEYVVYNSDQVQVTAYSTDGGSSWKSV